MTNPLPHYYARLEPFRNVFQSGNPVLTYHKLGPRPREVRLKGLYVSEGLFARQLQELRGAGFANGSLEACVVEPVGCRVTITFDDGYSNVLQYGVETLARVGYQAMLFVVADRLGRTNEWDSAVGEQPEPLMDKAQLREWLAAGQLIGSHSCTHPWLTRLPVQQAKEEITSSRKKLEDGFGLPIDHFCYPYGDWSPAIRDLVQEAGYKTACTTEAGVNRPGDTVYNLKRFTARYESRNLKSIWRKARELLKWGGGGRGGD